MGLEAHINQQIFFLNDELSSVEKALDEINGKIEPIELELTGYESAQEVKSYLSGDLTLEYSSAIVQEYLGIKVSYDVLNEERKSLRIKFDDATTSLDDNALLLDRCNSLLVDIERVDSSLDDIEKEYAALKKTKSVINYLARSMEKGLLSFERVQLKEEIEKLHSKPDVKRYLELVNELNVINLEKDDLETDLEKLTSDNCNHYFGYINNLFADASEKPYGSCLDCGTEIDNFFSYNFDISDIVPAFSNRTNSLSDVDVYDSIKELYETNAPLFENPTDLYSHLKGRLIKIKKESL